MCSMKKSSRPSLRFRRTSSNKKVGLGILGSHQTFAASDIIKGAFRLTNVSVGEIMRSIDTAYLLSTEDTLDIDVGAA